MKEINDVFSLPNETPNPHIYTVSELTKEIRMLLENSFAKIIVEGEISNVRTPLSGHCYFTIKDENAQIKVVLFRRAYEVQKVKPTDGMLIRVYGEITVYEKNGEYQIIAEKIEEAGKGSLYARLEALKEKLKKEGLFDESRKKQLPLLPLHIGVVTSPRGAAIRDMLKILNRRFPNLHILIVPVKVQGEEAAGEIARAINLLNEIKEVDVIIIGRGGGSIEDLWAFNEEIVVRTVAASQIPIISAVGHETDFTLCDFAADVRAPTPSAAAEIVIGRKEDFISLLTNADNTLKRSLMNSFTNAVSRLRSIQGHYVFKQPQNLISKYSDKLKTCIMTIMHSMENKFNEYSQKIDDFSYRQTIQLQIAIKEAKQEIKRLESHLKALDPLAVLNRGYSLTKNVKGKIIRSYSDVSVGDKIITLLANGILESTVVSTKKNHV